LKIPTRRFGTVEIAEDQVVYVPDGLIGFPGQKRYVLLEHKKGSPFVWFQAVDEEDLAFLLIDPLLCEPDYEFLIGPQDREALELSDSCEGMQTLVIVNITSAGPLEITANLLGPVVMNVKKRLARQIVLYQSPYSTRFPIPMVKK
jgi:flagellar assembly factor FliW